MITFCEHLLLENRVDVLKQKYKKQITDAYFEDTHDIDDDGASFNFEEDAWVPLLTCDPTHNKSYLDWVIRMYLKHDFHLHEDEMAINDLLAEYEHVKRHMPVEQRDINRFPSTGSLYLAIEEHNNERNNRAVASNKGLDHSQVASFGEQIYTVYRGPLGSIYQPRSQAAAVFLGRATRWCTSALQSNQFANYNRRGPLYIFITPKGDKYQAHAPKVESAKTAPTMEMYLNNWNAFMEALTYSYHFEFRDSADRTVETKHAFRKDPLWLWFVDNKMKPTNSIDMSIHKALRNHDVEQLKLAIKNPAYKKILQRMYKDWEDLENLPLPTSKSSGMVSMFKFVHKFGHLL